VAIALHTYFLFPQIIKVIASIIGRPNPKHSTNYPIVTIIISAFNEDKVINERIENLAALDYNKELLQVLIGSDGSTDGTNEILRSYSERYSWLEPVIFTENRGKAEVCNVLVTQSKGSILVFGDADHFYEPDAVKNIVQYFSDIKVGGVGGIINMRNAVSKTAIGVEEQSYYAYDTPIKIAEGDCGCMIGAHGGFFAVRKSLYEPIPVHLGVTDDFFISILPLWRGYKVVAARDAISLTFSAPSIKDEFRRKVRFSATSYATLRYFWKLLFDKRIILSYCFWSHRVSKWFFPFIMILSFVTNLILITNNVIYQIGFYLQCSIYILALIGYILSNFGVKFRVFSFPFYFVVSNAALFIGFIRFLRKSNVTRWKPLR